MSAIARILIASSVQTTSYRLLLLIATMARKKHLSLKGLFLFTAIILGPATTTALRAEEAPIGGWVIRHGALRIVYAFTGNGTYAYERQSPQIFDEETGRYSVEGHKLILQPDGKPQRVLQWWIGTDITAPYVLYLVDEFGRKEFFYPR